ncbi:hypothetical protein CIG21_02590 [Corynebacterium hadale]|uniref:Uncharacterized protein n=1 Tax=Corynebacterium hadale TaxID=2026255 RepID=A0A269PGB3_9CORY|nr:hypothetical protein CIG21_02590 [Corynebacterium hadale]
MENYYISATDEVELIFKNIDRLLSQVEKSLGGMITGTFGRRHSPVPPDNQVVSAIQSGLFLGNKMITPPPEAVRQLCFIEVTYCSKILFS